jgi:hypothetical protein
MALLGDHNCYLSSWLSWLPNVHVEGPAEAVASEPSPAD